MWKRQTDDITLLFVPVFVWRFLDRNGFASFMEIHICWKSSTNAFGFTANGEEMREQMYTALTRFPAFCEDKFINMLRFELGAFTGNVRKFIIN